MRRIFTAFAVVVAMFAGSLGVSLTAAVPDASAETCYWHKGAFVCTPVRELGQKPIVYADPAPGALPTYLKAPAHNWSKQWVYQSGKWAW